MTKTLMREKSISAPQERIWDILVDVEGWAKWDADVKTARLEGNFKEGAKGFLIDAFGARSDFEITAIDRLRAYSNMYFLADNGLLRFTHEIRGESSPYTVRFIAVFDGENADKNHSLMGEGLARTMENALDNLAALAVCEGAAYKSQEITCA